MAGFVVMDITQEDYDERIRNKAIDEFAEALKKEISFKYGSGQINRAYNAKEKTLKLIDEIAEQLKGEK